MKIFNWVHRKFHPKDERKSEALGTYGEMEKQILLKHVAFDNMLDSLGDGILSIGTLGFDPLPNLTNTNVDITNAIDHEAPPPHHGAQNNNYEGTNMVEKECDEEKEEIRPLVSSGYGSCDLNENNNIGSQSHDNYEIVEMVNSEYDNSQVMKNEKKERITLADLFLADEYCHDQGDHDHAKTNNKQDYGKLKKKGLTQTQNMKKVDHDADLGKKKFGKSFSKKLNLGSGGDPIKKVQGLMRKMIKKKIHPSIEEKIPKITDELVSLLLREVATA